MMRNRSGYCDKVDTWPLGVMLYELIVGDTPFHCNNMRELFEKINDGRYKLEVQQEEIMIETCLFMI